MEKEKTQRQLAHQSEQIMAGAKMTFPVQTNWVSATRLEGWRPASSTSFYWCCQISAADFFACFFVWWFSPSSRSSCAYLWSLIKCGSLFSAFPQWFIQCRSSSDNRTARTFTNAVAFLLWLYLFLFFYFRSEGNFSPLDFFFLCSKSRWEFIKLNLLLSCLFFFSKLNFFFSVNIGSMICAITWNF